MYVRLPYGRVVELRKYIYGLKQAGYEWMNNVNNILISKDYKQCSDPSLFVKRKKYHFL